MKKILLLSLLITISIISFAQVSINTDGSNPDNSAMLDIKSDTAGILIPRMTKLQRNAINSPANGLLIYQTNASPGFYFYNGINWVLLTDSTNVVRKIDDLDDGKSGNSGYTLYIGVDAGQSDVGAARNTGIGYSTLKSNSIGKNNTALGFQSLYSNTYGSSNTAIGVASLFNNTIRSDLVAVGDSALFRNGVGVIYFNDAIHNTAVGSKALYSNTVGSYNTATGYKALHLNTEGDRNTAYGHTALSSNTSGDNNLAIGESALYYNSTGANNTASGSSALLYNTIGSGNTASGYRALRNNSTGFSNTACGSQSLKTNTTGNWNTAIGWGALFYNDDASQNTAIGCEALYYNVSGMNNTAIGRSAIISNTTGEGNTAIGVHTLSNNTTGSYNTAMGLASGYFGGYNNTSMGYHSFSSNNGNNNTAIGYEALKGYNSNVNYNTALGYQAGYRAAGNKNVFIGYKAGYYETGANKLYIENTINDGSSALIYGEFDNNILRTNGEFQIGDPASTGYKFPTAKGTNNQILQTDGNGQLSWIDLPPSVIGSIDIHSDVDVSTTAPTNSQVLKWDGSNWVPANDLGGTINDLSDAKTTIGSCVFLGNNAGASITSGTGNSALGYEALNAATTGSCNIASGYHALYHTTSGEHNIAIGFNAYNTNTTGNHNTVLGSYAGFSSTGSDNVFLGYQAGYNEAGSNKLYIANSNTTTPLIGGDFSTSQVDINGTIKITGGSPGANKVLTSDANGLASWTTPQIGAQQINDLSDVDVTTSSPTNGQVLSWDGTNWVPANDNNTVYSAGTGLQLLGTVFSLNSGIDNLNDVDVSTTLPVSGQVLSWDGSNWVPTDDQGATKINDLTDGKNDNSSIFVGTNAGTTDDGTANLNAGFGNGALSLNSTGELNTAIGSYAMNANTSGVENLAIGSYALYNNQTGNNNTVIGRGAGLQATGSANVFIGYRAGNGETGSNKLYIANSATTSPLIGGDFSIAQVDINGTIKITGGSPGSGKVLTSDVTGVATWQTPGAPTIAINDLTDGKTVSNSVFLGPNAGQSNTVTGNTALGNAAFFSNTTGVNNTTIGAGAYAYSSSGDSNTVIGYMAGVFDASGNPTTNLESSILIGSRTRPLSTGDLNEIVIGMGVTGLGSNTVTLGDINIVKTALYGKVGIGTTTPQSTLEVNGGVKVANDADTASASKVGTLRYRSDSNNSYVEMCVQTGASSYTWKIINHETW